MNVLVGISGKMASGKDTLADFITPYFKSPKSISFGKLIRLEIKEVVELGLLNIARAADKFNVEEYEVVKLIETLGNKDIFSRSPNARKALQYWGTEVRRKQDGNYWIKKMKLFITKEMNQGHSVFLTDARFPVEVDLIKELNGVIIRLEADEEVRKKRIMERDGIIVTDEALSHSSEIALDNYIFENILHNNTHSDEIKDEALKIIFRKGDR